MSLENLKSNVKQKRKKVGRGNASGHGTFCCRGVKGQNSRTGGKRRPGFEGGQTSFFMKMPKLKGFRNPNHIIFQTINTGDLNIFEDGTTVDLDTLIKKNLISKKNIPVKLLGGKDKLEKKLIVIVHKASKTAILQIEELKGSVQLLSLPKVEEKTKTE